MIASVIGKCFRVYLSILTMIRPADEYIDDNEKEMRNPCEYNAAHAPVYGHNALSLSIMRVSRNITHTQSNIDRGFLLFRYRRSYRDERRVSK
jgi:hypothetical protein